MAFLKRSPWVIHYDASSCNGCDIEVLACLTPVYDLERLGIINTGNPKHADILLITGSINEQNKDVVLNIYNQMPDPKVVVAIGICATSGGVFAECYNVSGGVDKLLPVDVYVPGCAARPESIMDGVLTSLKILSEKHRKFKSMQRGLETMSIEMALVEDADNILALQKMAYQSVAEIYHDFSIPSLRQDITELRDDFKRMIFLKAVTNGQLVGSVRGYLENGICHISRLIVHPTYQNLGIGKKLLHDMEAYFSASLKYEVYTGHKSKRNIYFYNKNGYRSARKEKITDQITRVYFEKEKKAAGK